MRVSRRDRLAHAEQILRNAADDLRALSANSQHAARRPLDQCLTNVETALHVVREVREAAKRQ